VAQYQAITKLVENRVSADNFRIWPLDPASGNNVVLVFSAAPNSVEFRRFLD
jgi:hypothetical protein